MFSTRCRQYRLNNTYISGIKYIFFPPLLFRGLFLNTFNSLIEWTNCNLSADWQAAIMQMQLCGRFGCVPDAARTIIKLLKSNLFGRWPAQTPRSLFTCTSAT